MAFGSPSRGRCSNSTRCRCISPRMAGLTIENGVCPSKSEARGLRMGELSSQPSVLRMAGVASLRKIQGHVIGIRRSFELGSGMRNSTEERGIALRQRICDKPHIPPRRALQSAERDFDDCGPAAGTVDTPARYGIGRNRRQICRDEYRHDSRRNSYRTSLNMGSHDTGCRILFRAYPRTGNGFGRD